MCHDWLYVGGHSLLNAKGNAVVHSIQPFSTNFDLSQRWKHSCAFLFRNHAFFRKLRNFQYFEILSKSDLLEMKQNLCIA